MKGIILYQSPFLVDGRLKGKSKQPKKELKENVEESRMEESRQGVYTWKAL